VIGAVSDLRQVWSGLNVFMALLPGAVDNETLVG
jgi:hypothetical protein